MVKNTKIICIHCGNHLGNHHDDGGIIVVPIIGKSVIARSRLKKVYDGIPNTCIGSYISVMSIRLECLRCNRNTTYECQYNEETDLDDWDLE